MPVWCVLKMYNPFHITDGPFSRPAEWKLSSSWKILQPNRPDKATYLANHKKTRLWPWTQLSVSRRTVLSGFLLFVEHVDNGIRRRHGERTRTGKNRSRGRRLHSFEHTAQEQWLQPSHPKVVLPGFDSNWCSWKISNTCQNFVPSLPSFSHTQHCLAILKIAYLFDFASYEDVLYMNVDQHDVNLLLVPFFTMNKISNILLSMFEKCMLI